VLDEAKWIWEKVLTTQPIGFSSQKTGTEFHKWDGIVVHVAIRCSPPAIIIWEAVLLPQEKWHDQSEAFYWSLRVFTDIEPNKRIHYYGKGSRRAGYGMKSSSWLSLHDVSYITNSLINAPIISFPYRQPPSANWVLIRVTQELNSNENVVLQT